MARINSLTGTDVKASHWAIRFWEIIPGFLSWATLILPVFLSIYQPFVIAYFIIAFDLYWLLKSLRMSTALIAGYRRYRQAMRISWPDRLEHLQLENKGQRVIEEQIGSLVTQTSIFSLFSRRGRLRRAQIREYRDESQNLEEYMGRTSRQTPDELYHVVILATYNESLETLRPSLQALAESEYDMKRVIFMLAYEERGGEAIEDRVMKLRREFKGKFGQFYISKHPEDIVGENKGKGANIVFAARQLMPEIAKLKIPVEDIIVTTLDSDHRVDKRYLACLSYSYLIAEDPKHISFQPLPLFFNNIWDAPAPMRVIATSNSFWVIINSVRPQFLRNFAAHAQSLVALLDTDFWSVTSPVEDGHQYWRTFFRYHGQHTVEPLFVPIYQDAILSRKYLATFKSQFHQLQRWAYGVSDVPYVAILGWRHKEIPLGRRWIQFWRLFEGHYSWAIAPLILTFVAWLPLFINPTFKNTVLAHQLPIIASQIMTLAMAGLSLTVWISLITLPPRPHRYSWFKNIAMLLQWVLAPVVALCFGAFAALNAQTHLMLGRYLGFRVSEKATKEVVEA